LGIVDGTMGILSRKMALEGPSPTNFGPVNFNSSTSPYSSSPHRHNNFGSYDKVLGQKNYTMLRHGEIIQHSMELLIE
jgi:hypothetical protein